MLYLYTFQQSCCSTSSSPPTQLKSDAKKNIGHTFLTTYYFSSSAPLCSFSPPCSEVEKNLQQNKKAIELQVCQKSSIRFFFASDSTAPAAVAAAVFMDSSHHIETHVDTHFNHMHHELFTEEDKKLFWFGIRSNAIKIKWGKLSFQFL